MRGLMCVLVAAMTLLAVRPARAFTAEQVAAFLRHANPDCTVNVVSSLTGPVRGADTPVTIVKYGVEGCGGGNNWTVALAVLHDAGHGQVAAFEDARLRLPIVDRVGLSGGTIQVRTLDWGPRDAHCCPSVHGSLRLIVRGDSLVAVP